MATVTELFYNRTDKFDESAEVPYLVVDAVDEAAVETACDAAIPSTQDNLYLDDVSIEERINNTEWRVMARYAKREWTESPDSRFSFDTSGGTAHITTSRELIERYKTSANLAYDTKEVIGYDPDSQSVKGADIIVPVFNFSETHFFSNSAITNAYKVIIRNLTGRVNNASFKGHAAGEVLFLGAAGARQGDDSDDKWEITFRFAAQENETAVDIPGDIIGPIAKKGWEYMTVQFQKDTVNNDDTKPVVVKIPVAAYIHRVYKSGDFSTLNIGTT